MPEGFHPPVEEYLETIHALTEKGQARAASVVRRHRLAERFLVDVLGLPWHLAHEEAGQWEHVISDAVEARLVELMGHPTTCPHGNPIPGEPVSDEVQVAMTELTEGSRVRLARITEVVENDHDALVYLADHGLTPGAAARVSARAPDGTLTLALDGADGASVALGPAICRQLFVTALA